MTPTQRRLLVRLLAGAGLVLAIGVPLLAWLLSLAEGWGWPSP